MYCMGIFKEHGKITKNVRKVHEKRKTNTAVSIMCANFMFGDTA